MTNSGQFKKGMTSWNKGKKGLPATNGLKGKKMPEAWKKALRVPKSVTYKGKDHHSFTGGNAVAQKRNWLKMNYGISLEEYNQMFVIQDSRCAICGGYQKENPTPYERLCVDHNHETKKVRGLLCRKCNAGIGQLGDNIQLVENALAYLIKHHE